MLLMVIVKMRNEGLRMCELKILYSRRGVWAA